MNLFQRAFHLAHHIFPEGGSCLEFGVFRGGTYAYQAGEIVKNYPKSTLIGFDSWQGLPEETSGVWAPERHAVGHYSAPKSEVRAKLEALGIGENDSRFRLVDGFYSESLTPALRKEVGPVIFVNIDVDIYRSTIELLDFVGPLLRPGVVLYWDDWLDPRDEHKDGWGEHQAWDDWVAKNLGIAVDTIEVNAVNQRTMVVKEANGAKLAKPMADIRYHALELSLLPNDARKETDYEVLSGLLKRQARRVPLARSIAKAVRRRP